MVEHPDYKSLLPSEKNQFNAIIKEILPKTETLKQKILKKFQKEFEEYIIYQQEQEQTKKMQKEREMAEKKIRMEEEERQRRLNQEKQRLLDETREQIENIKLKAVADHQDPPAFTVLPNAPSLYESIALPR